MRTGPTYNVDRMIVTPCTFEVPLDWTKPDGESISIHAKVVVAAEKQREDLPFICWFQGGPGFEAYRPVARSGHLDELLNRYRVVLLDQRGMGLSSPLDGPSVVNQDSVALAQRLRHFRAGSTVRDAEQLRENLGATSWSIIGHSYGGFCVLSYLSFFNDHVDAAMIMGGFAPVLHNAHEVYAALTKVMIRRNERYFERFPQDVENVRCIVDALATGNERYNGCVVTPEQFLQLGYLFGDATGDADVHAIVERAASDLALNSRISQRALSEFFDVMTLSLIPIYAVLHEAIYCQGVASNWAADAAVHTFPQFSRDALPCPYFRGEMVDRTLFDSLPALAPLKEAADLLATYEDWGDLYDIDALRRNQVPVAGTIFQDDVYVYRDFAIETAELVGNCSYWLTNEYGHQAHKDDPKRVMNKLFDMLDEKILPH